MRLFFNLSVDRLVMRSRCSRPAPARWRSGCCRRCNGARVDLLSAIKADLSPRGPGRGRVRMALVVSQVAVSVLLLVGAGLVSRSLDATRQADPGFDASDVVVEPSMSPPTGTTRCAAGPCSPSCSTGCAPSPAPSRRRWPKYPADNRRPRSATGGDRRLRVRRGRGLGLPDQRRRARATSAR